MPMIRALVLSLVLACAAAAETLSVGAAISLKEALASISDSYHADMGNTIELSFGSSGQLEAQIRAGAPIDVFISAANKQVKELSKAHLIDDASRRIVARNSLVLIVPADAKVSVSDFQDLTGPQVHRIAAGEPKTVPAGQYAAQVFKSLKIVDAIADKLVYGTNVRQVLDYVERGEVAAGVVYKTDALQSGDKVKIVATADSKTHEPILYPAVIVKASKKHDAAAKFLEYLTSEKARAALAAKGFLPGESPATDSR